MMVFQMTPPSIHMLEYSHTTLANVFIYQSCTYHMLIHLCYNPTLLTKTSILSMYYINLVSGTPRKQRYDVKHCSPHDEKHQKSPNLHHPPPTKQQGTASANTHQACCPTVRSPTHNPTNLAKTSRRRESTQQQRPPSKAASPLPRPNKQLQEGTPTQLQPNQQPGSTQQHQEQISNKTT